MAHIDVNAIPGYEGLTEAEKLRAILGLEIPDPVDMTQYVKKSVFDKTASDLAAAKKTIEANMSAEQIAAEEAKKAAEEREALIAELKRDKAISDNEKALLKKGVSPDLACELAEALASGDTARIMECYAKHDAAREQSIRADITRNNPKPSGAEKGEKGEEISGAEKLAIELGKRAAMRKEGANSALQHYIHKNNE